MQDPVVQIALGRGLEQLAEVGGAQVGRQRDACSRHVFVHEQAPQRHGQQADRVELAQAVVDFERGESEQQRDREAAPSRRRLARGWVLQVRAQEGSDVGPRLRDDEVVDVEELRDAREGGFAVRVVGLPPGVEGDFLARGPGHDGARFVLAFEDYGRVERGG